MVERGEESKKMNTLAACFGHKRITIIKSSHRAQHTIIVKSNGREELIQYIIIL